MSDNALKTATDKYRPTVTPVTSVGNKSATQTGKPIFTEGDIRVSINDAVTVTFEDISKGDLSLKPVLSLNNIDEKGEPQMIELTKGKNTYTFSGLKKELFYYIDYYATKDAPD